MTLVTLKINQGQQNLIILMLHLLQYGHDLTSGSEIECRQGLFDPGDLKGQGHQNLLIPFSWSK